MNILIVDDDEIALLTAKKILESEGYDVILASDGEEAMDKARRQETHIVISDWNMPKMDGIQLCRYIRENTGIGYVYFIIVTSRTGKQDIDAGLEAGADDFITKPFEPAELLFRVRTAERILSLETTSVTLFSLAKLAESKDTDTGGHLERMREYSRILAGQLIINPGFKEIVSPQFPELIYQTSPLHDIGKVGIPDSILLKPGSLNDEEWLVMKRHTEIGAETLNAALDKFPGAEFLRIARDIAWAHHERWDGTGYPRGLKGSQIPLCARVVALADVYDAMTIRRVYKSALTHEVAHWMIVVSSEKHFDPQVVEVYKQVEDQFIEIRQKFMERYD
jgi:putative two-component system response regulator